MGTLVAGAYWLDTKEDNTSALLRAACMQTKQRHTCVPSMHACVRGQSCRAGRCTDREEEEELGELPLAEVVGEVLHRVVPYARDVLVLPRVALPQHRCKPKDVARLSMYASRSVCTIQSIAQFNTGQYVRTRFSVYVPRFGMYAPRVGMYGQTFGMYAPRLGMYDSVNTATIIFHRVCSLPPMTAMG
jgi:hypothetical protein